MYTHTSAVKSLYVNTREVLPRLHAEPKPWPPGIETSLNEYFKDYPALEEQSATLFYRPISFTASLNQPIEIPREGLTTLELSTVKTNESVCAFDFYELTSQNLGFVLTIQNAPINANGQFTGEPVSEYHVVIRHFDRDFYFGENVHVQALSYGGAPWELEPDPLVNGQKTADILKISQTSNKNTPITCVDVHGSARTQDMELRVKEHKNNLIFRINQYLAGYGDTRHYRPLEFANTPQKHNEELFPMLAKTISQARLVLTPNGTLLLASIPDVVSTHVPETRSAFSIYSGAGTTQLYTLGKYLNLRMRHEKDQPFSEKLPLYPDKPGFLAVGRCHLDAIQPVLKRQRNILRIVLSCSATSSNQYFWAQKSRNVIVQNDWTNTVGILSCDEKGLRLIHTEKVNLAPGTHMDSLQLAVVNEYNDVIWTSNDLMFFFKIENDSSQHNPTV